MRPVADVWRRNFPAAPMMTAITSSGTPIAGDRKIVSAMPTTSPTATSGTNQSVSLEGIQLAHTLGSMARNRVGTAIAIAGFATGMLIWFINPPSLSGAGGLVSLALGATAFILASAWLTVRMMGRDAIPEEQFERIVRRSEELARQPRLAREATEFELIVAEAIDRLPPEFQTLLADTPVIVSQRGAESRAYGHYFGDTVAGRRYEHRIVIYQDTLVRDFGWDPEALATQVGRTLRQEITHHLGWNERTVGGLGV